MLLHVAAVDGRHGWRPAGPRPAPTLPRQGLGFWRSTEGPRAGKRGTRWAAVVGGAGSIPHDANQRTSSLV